MRYVSLSFASCLLTLHPSKLRVCNSGIFILMSMLIATFEKSYGIQKHKLTDHVRRNQYMGHAVSFILITWDAPLLEDQNAPGLYFKGMSRESFINLFSNGQNRWCSLPTHCIVLTATSLIGIAYSQSVCTIVAVILHTLFSHCCLSRSWLQDKTNREEFRPSSWHGSNAVVFGHRSSTKHGNRPTAQPREQLQTCHGPYVPRRGR